MNFLERTKSAFSKNNATDVQKQPSVNFGKDFNRNALKEKELATDVFQTSSYVQNPIADKNLAEQSPVEFINTYVNKETIENALQKNPNIQAILEEYKLPIEYNLSNYTNIIQSHILPTAQKAQAIYLKAGNKQDIQNFRYITEAALLHDIGKIFIPEKILNKPTRLSLKEREIIELHNRLGYEILKTTNLNPKTIQLVLEHHDYEDNIVKTQENQILTIADVYSALTEKRSYKRAMTKIEALATLYKMGQKKKLTQDMYNI